jgi:hypothetical protein
LVGFEGCCVTNAEGDVRLGIVVAPIDTNDTA